MYSYYSSSDGSPQCIRSGESERYSMDLITTEKENLESNSPGAQPTITTERSSEVAECSATSSVSIYQIRADYRS